MADTQKPVEETPAVSAPATESTPATESKPAETTEAPATSTEAPSEAKEETVKKDESKLTDTKVGEAKVEATPASEGVLGHKASPFPK